MSWPIDDMGDSFAKETAKSLSIAQITLGALSIFSQILIIITIFSYDVSYYENIAGTGEGIYCGVFFVLAGFLGLLASGCPSTCNITAFMTMSIIASIVSAALIILAGVNLLGLHMGPGPGSTIVYAHDVKTGLFCAMILSALTEGVVSIVSSAVCCRAYCENGRSLQLSQGIQYANFRHGKTDIMRCHTKLGVVRLDYDYNPSLGDIDHPDSFSYSVIYRVVPGLTFDMCKSGELTQDVQAEFIEAVKWLDQRNVSAITGDCGFMMYFQKLARAHSLSPVFMSSLTQLPALTCVFHPRAQICILTANLASLRPMKDLILDTIGWDADEERFIMVGCEGVPGFEAVEKGEELRREVVEPGVVNLALETLEKNPGIKAFLFECTQISTFSDAVREATGVPVYDAITGCDFFVTGFQDNIRFGKNNWKKTWDGHKDEYTFGQNLDEEDKMKLISRKWDN